MRKRRCEAATSQLLILLIFLIRDLKIPGNEARNLGRRSRNTETARNLDLETRKCLKNLKRPLENPRETQLVACMYMMVVQGMLPGGYGEYEV